MRSVAATIPLESNLMAGTCVEARNGRTWAVPLEVADND